MMAAAGFYAHKRCLDVGIRVININYITETVINLRVEWVYKDKKRGSLGVLETILIKARDWHNWERI